MIKKLFINSIKSELASNVDNFAKYPQNASDTELHHIYPFIRRVLDKNKYNSFLLDNFRGCHQSQNRYIFKTMQPIDLRDFNVMPNTEANRFCMQRNSGITILKEKEVDIKSIPFIEDKISKKCYPRRLHIYETSPRGNKLEIPHVINSGLIYNKIYKLSVKFVYVDILKRELSLIIRIHERFTDKIRMTRKITINPADEVITLEKDIFLGEINKDDIIIIDISFNNPGEKILFLEYSFKLLSNMFTIELRESNKTPKNILSRVSEISTGNLTENPRDASCLYGWKRKIVIDDENDTFLSPVCRLNEKCKCHILSFCNCKTCSEFSGGKNWICSKHLLREIDEEDDVSSHLENTISKIDKNDKVNKINNRFEIKDEMSDDDDGDIDYDKIKNIIGQKESNSTRKIKYIVKSSFKRIKKT